MHAPRKAIFIAFAVATLSSAPNLSAQLLTGSIVGTLVDAHGAAIPGVRVRVTSDSTGAVRDVMSDERGSFALNAVPPGTYTLLAEHGGFKKYERRNVNLEPNDHLSMGEIQLEVGGVTEMVTVTAEGATVQTASSERSGIITSEQIEDLTVINRDFAALVSLLPGVVMDQNAEVQGLNGSARFNVNGGRQGQNSITIDGIPSDNSNGTGVNNFASMEAISRVKILVSNFQAEFGRKPAAGIQAVTKSGGQQYHGAAYWYQRNEAFNARPWLNKITDVPDPPYRYITAGVSFGGPVYIPKLLGRNQKKLFFFFSEEQQRELRPQDIQQILVPTGLERQGDFSKSFDASGKLRLIKDPNSGLPCKNADKSGPSDFRGCFQDEGVLGRIPQSQIHLLGQRYLSLLPLPNVDTIGASKLGGLYNYQVQESLKIPKHTETARVDYNLTPKTALYTRFNYWWEDAHGFAVSAANAKWGWLPSTYNGITRTVSISGTHIFSPSLILEGSTAFSRWTEAAHPEQRFLDARNRVITGVTIPQFHPENNPLNLVPQAKFGGLTNTTNTPNTTLEGRFPITGVENILTWNAMLTKVYRSHTAKVGLFIEHWQELKAPNGNFAGQFDYSSNASGFVQGNSGNPFANALLGNFWSYTESTTRPPLVGRENGVEWFLQDNWRATRKLTLDLGLRLGWSQPFHTTNRAEAGFVADRFDPSSAVRLIQPTATGCGSLGRRCGWDPKSGRFFPEFAIGAMVPGSGDRFDGTVDRRVDPNYPQGLRNTSGIKLAPRVGFAYDPFGRGKTAIRGGFGIFYEIRERDNLYLNIFKNVPLQLNPSLFTGNLNTFINQAGYDFPSSTSGIERSRPLPHVMHFSLGIQHEVGFGTVVDLSYVGALGRHLLDKRNLNPVPLGANINPPNPPGPDPTMSGNKALPDNFYRPFAGYQDITFFEYASTSNYHSLQVAVNRRFAKGLQFGSAWTWSKSMDYVDDENKSLSAFGDPRLRDYGKAGFDHTHIVKIYWTWEIPRASRLWNTAWVRGIFENWTLSGITTFQSGAPLGITLSAPSAGSVSGSPSEGARVNLLESAILPKDQRTPDRYFDTSAIGLPASGSIGNAPKDVFRGPGINNWDLSLFKRVPLRTEHCKLQFRAEAYNAFNHTQFSKVNTNARFVNGKLETPGQFGFGSVTAALSPRRLQLALRLGF